MKLYLKGKFIYEQLLVIEKSVEITIYLADTMERYWFFQETISQPTGTG